MLAWLSMDSCRVFRLKEILALTAVLGNLDKTKRNKKHAQMKEKPRTEEYVHRSTHAQTLHEMHEMHELHELKALPKHEHAVLKNGVDCLP